MLTIRELKAKTEEDPKLKQKLQEDPLNTLTEIMETHPLKTDKWIYRIIVTGLLIVILGTLLAVFMLLKKNIAIPDYFDAIITLALGALVGLIAPQPS